MLKTFPNKLEAYTYLHSLGKIKHIETSYIGDPTFADIELDNGSIYRVTDEWLDSVWTVEDLKEI